MPSSFFLHAFLLGILFVPNIFAQSQFDTITDPAERAESALSSLQQWYNTSTGIWESTGWWNSANIMTTIGNFAKADPQNADLQKIARKTFAVAVHRAPSKNPNPGIENPNNKTSALSEKKSWGTGYHKYFNLNTHEPYTVYPSNWFDSSDQAINFTGSISEPNLDSFKPNPSDWLDGYYDDDLWWALAWINAYDVTHHTPYLHLAEGIFLAVTKSWPTNCFNGGIYWNMTSGYVNAIANELFFSMAAHLANRAENQHLYIDWAQRSLNWFLNSGMINSDSTINDGLENCANNNGTAWSYNQGVILGGLVELNRASPHTTYIPLATRIAKAALEELSDADGVIHDGCEPDCGGDGAQFKGVFMRNLAELQLVAPDRMFEWAIRRNAESIWWNDRVDGREGVVFSVDWAGPFVWPANASTHSSAMDALVADVAVG